MKRFFQKKLLRELKLSNSIITSGHILWERPHSVFETHIAKKISIIVFNILLATIVISDPIRVINTDGVLYLKTAQVYWVSGWQAAVHSYPWPFYSALIAWLAYPFNWPLEQTAYVVNVFFQILLSLGFYNLVCEIKGIHCRANSLSSLQEKDRNAGIYDNQFMWLVVFVILCFPMLNQFRDLIIRDFGYWAFSLWAWLFLIQLSQTGSILKCIQFSVAMLLAGLFRLEGIVMLLLGPLGLLGLKNKLWIEKFKLLAKAYSVIVIGCAIAGMYLTTDIHAIEKFGRLLDFKAPLYAGISNILHILSQAKLDLRQHVLTQVSADSASSLLFGALIILYLKTLVTTLTPFYSLLTVITQWKKKFTVIANANPILCTAIFLNVIVTVVFMLESLFLANRYIFALCLVLLLWVPFGLLWLYEQADQQKKIFWSILAAMGVLAILSVCNFGPSKAYLKDAGHWIYDKIPENQYVYTNSPQLYFYANHPHMTYKNNIKLDDTIAMAKSHEYHYFAFQIKSSNTLLKKQLTQQWSAPIKIFSNDRQDEVWIYGR